jgi:kynurenine formamidase
MKSLLRNLFLATLVILAINTACHAEDNSKKKIVDLTHVLTSSQPDFQLGEESFHYTALKTLAKDGYAIGSFCTAEHYGTHIDAPSHFAQGQPSIDEISADKFILPCVVIDVRKEVESNPDYCLTVDKIKAFERGGKIPKGSAVLLCTGWSDKWTDVKAYRNADDKGVMHFPGFSDEAADYLVSTREVAALGIDTLSIDYGASHDYPVHSHALAKGIFMIENLDNLSQLPARNATLYCGPLKIKGGTGSPARIICVLPEGVNWKKRIFQMGMNVLF